MKPSVGIRDKSRMSGRVLINTGGIFLAGGERAVFGTIELGCYWWLGGIEEAVEDLGRSRIRYGSGITGEKPGVVGSLRGQLLFQFDPGSLSWIEIGKVNAGGRVGRK